MGISKYVIVVLAGLGGALVGASVSSAQSSSSGVIEEVIVSGIRGSLQGQLSMKRNADGILDGISAEDIGKLPDENVAESLQRINGVQIQRRNGEGAGVSVRGLEQNRLAVDGITLVNPTGRNRGADEGTFPVLQFIPSELLSGIQVYKSPSADQVEGALGGTVNLTLLKPLEVGNRFLIASQGSHDDRTKDTDPRFSASWSQVFADNTLGVLVSVAQSERSVGEELFFTRTGWGTSADGLYSAPGDVRLQDLEEDRERRGLLGSVQWRPSASTELSLTSFFASYDLERDRFWFSSAESGGTDPAQYVGGMPVVTGRGSIVAGSWVDQIQGNGEHLTNDSETSSLILSGEHVFEQWTFSGKLTSGEASQNNVQNFARLRQNGIVFQRDFRGSVPVLNVLGDGSGDPANPSTFDVLDPTSYELSSGLIGFANRALYENEESTLQIDVDYEMPDEGFFTSLEAGFRHASQESTRVSSRAAADDGSSVWLVPVDSSGMAGSVELTNAIFRVVSMNDIYGGRSNLGAFLAADPSALGGLGALLNFANINSPGGTRANQGIFQARPGDTYGTEETITSFYVKANFSDHLLDYPISGNFGIRYVDTEQDSEFFSPISGGGVVADSSDRSYDHILPSANLRVDVRDDLLLRLSVSQALSRPSTLELAGSLTLDEPAGTGSTGNPDLDLVEADALDASLEWYISDVSSVSGSLFYKDVEGFLETIAETRNFPSITNERDGSNDFLVTTVVAGESSDLKGLEVAYQNVWRNGFGILLNYTYVDSSGVGDLPLSSLSENSYNLIAFYERDNYSVRLAYNWRDEYLVTPSFNGSPLYQEARGQLDLSAHYKVPQVENLELTLEAINLNDEGVNEYATLEERTFRVANTGRRFFIGVRYKFF